MAKSKLTTLDGVKSGVYVVYTETSSYIINFNKGTAKRIPGGGLGKDPDTQGDVKVSLLRKDNEWFEVLHVDATVGQIMNLTCKAIADIDYTWRRTTIVRKIEKIDGRKKV